MFNGFRIALEISNYTVLKYLFDRLYWHFYLLYLISKLVSSEFLIEPTIIGFMSNTK